MKTHHQAARQQRRRVALISVYDKTSIVGLAASLAELEWELLASSGTAELIAAAGFDVTDIADYTGLPPLLSHRVVTLHPLIHSGILADTSNATHMKELESGNIKIIDLVVANLYPFKAQPSIQTIDIGGSALLRAAAKNHARVGVVVNPEDYPLIMSELAAHGQLEDDTRLRLAYAAFAHTSTYDKAIETWFASQMNPNTFKSTTVTPTTVTRNLSIDTTQTPTTVPQLPPVVQITLERAEELRYGENPHQRAARYRLPQQAGFFDKTIRRGGKPLSYLNLVDAAAAWELACGLNTDRPAAVILKHANPCGAATADHLDEAYKLALACDTTSAFGGIIALNATIDDATASAIIAGPQADIIIATGFKHGTCERLHARRTSTRLLEVPPEAFDSSGCREEENPAISEDNLPIPKTADDRSHHSTSTHSEQTSRQRTCKPVNGLLQHWELRQLGDEFLLQDVTNRYDVDPHSWEVASARHPTVKEQADAVFAWKVCAATVSNAVVFAQDGVAWGIGAGQQNRLDATQLAVGKAAGRAAGGACASDGFYPFPDGVEAAAAAGVAVIVQPGGSINDRKVVAAADSNGIAMLFTGQRQFRH
ncbi:MAG: bifunctional phosphoribosylaminoimidazolecarboxamide formyltransferase/IMP cyclohydrolase [Acidimicrobiaceae bacterium]|nr:bifunctional phosphoribosylaminoimidazolecarboxamide formyltransferase/IMP cyclohydrolase [Acidimicrobiaceae bacterium]